MSSFSASTGARPRAEKRLFSYPDINGDPEESRHVALSPYLFDAGGLADPHIVVREESAPINGMRRLMVTARNPSTDGEYIFSTQKSGPNFWKPNRAPGNSFARMSVPASICKAESAGFWPCRCIAYDVDESSPRAGTHCGGSQIPGEEQAPKKLFGDCRFPMKYNVKSSPPRRFWLSRK